MNFSKVLSKLLLFECVLFSIEINAAPFTVSVVRGIKEELRYVNSETLEPVDLSCVLQEYNYRGEKLPQSDEDLKQYLEQYNNSNEYLLLCDARFLDPIKSTIWKIRFSIINERKYPDEIIKELETFCMVVTKQEQPFKNFLIKVLFKLNGLCDLYTEVKDLQSQYGRDLFLEKFRADFNNMLDIVDRDEEIRRFKR